MKTILAIHIIIIDSRAGCASSFSALCNCTSAKLGVLSVDDGKSIGKVGLLLSEPAGCVSIRR